MKKYILLLLLATFGMQAQTLQNPTYGKLKLKTNTESTTAEKVNVQETDGTINTISKSDLVNVVDVNDVHSLPLVGEVGKIYVVKNLNKIYRWNGTFYHELASSNLNYQSIIDALTFTPENVANKSSTLTSSSTLYPNNDAVIVGLATKEDKANKVTSISLSANDTNYPSELAVKTYADNLVVGMLNDRGTWDASGNVFPTTGGSGVGGAIRKGDMWYISVAGTLGTKSVNVGDSFRALVNAPSQVAANWSILEANIGYVPANDSNVVHLTGAETITGVKSFSPNLNILNNSGYSSLSITSNSDVNWQGSRSAFLRRRGTSSIPLAVQSGDVAGILDFQAYDGLDIQRLGQISASVDGSVSNGITPGKITFITTNSSGISLPRFVMYANDNASISSNGGRLLVGSTTDDGINRIQVTGTVSSGTTALGNTPPTANNQLTRKDYVDTGLALKEPSFSKNTAFNKNFGTTAGTVVEGGTLGLNAYSSTPYLPLSGGDVSSAINFPQRVNGNTSFEDIITYGFPGQRSKIQGLNNYAANVGAGFRFITHNVNNVDVNSLILDTDGAAIFASTVTATSFFQSSDRRLKTVLKRDGDMIYFKWKDGRDDKVHIGYIAQEVRKTNPNQVQKGEDKMLSVNYVEILVEKIRVLEKRIEQLEKK